MCCVQEHLSCARSKSVSKRDVRKRKRDESVGSKSHVRSSSRTPRDKSGVRDEVVSGHTLYCTPEE